jgi:DNA mismatch repair endonuclease MutH
MEFQTESELMIHAKKLEGLRFSEISAMIGQLDETHRKHTKGVAAKVIETEYFGIPTNSSEAPDFENLGIELKVSPLRYIERLELYTTKERNVIKMVDYNEIANNTKWEQTKVKKKLTRILFVLYVHDNSVNAWDWKVAKVFLWSPSNQQKKFIQSDYEIMRQNVLAGNNLREGDHTFFATCPKHGGGYLKHTPLDSPNSALADHPRMGKAEKRGYCIKREAFIVLIAESIGAPLVQKGRSIGIAADYLEV